MAELHLGFTGNRQGWSDPQRATVVQVLTELHPAWIHHGDCVGSDALMHHLALAHSIKVCIHPPLNSSCRAWCKDAAEVRPLKEYIPRDHDIVLETAELIATPYGREQVRSGTWATVRFARKLKRTIWIVYPDGGLVRENAAL